jgi:hypothetical protein
LNWLYNGKEVNDEDIVGHFGFVYIITRLSDGKAYIGKKQLTSTRKKKLTKKELAAAPVKPGRKPTTKKVTSESDWKSYWGSEPTLKQEVKTLGESHFQRVILRFCKSKKQLSYYEENEQHIRNVLAHPDKFYNSNISGRYFRKDLL